MSSILYVDNEQETTNLVKNMFEELGHALITAPSEKICLAKIREKQPDIILLKVMLSNISIWELYQKIKKLNKDIKVIFLSSIPISEERKQDLIESGIADYIMEPFTKEKLVQSVNAMLYEPLY
jgi:DNA-binding response OmpR family regulator